jgi:hypothetical protein
MTSQTELYKEVKWLAFFGYFAFGSLLLITIVDLFNSPHNETITVMVPMLMIGTLAFRSSAILNKVLKRVEQLEEKSDPSNAPRDA